ncbi:MULTISPECIES: LysR family transcriptional regulator [Micrococcaceae]|uniref:LysR family transcriptional regulator n=1 Tax=Micrococcaceae TaxID=1268 RepID=UPI002AA5EB89|nr:MULTISPECIES: LysR family transcriptional regulator [Pseudarthrobacter]MEA3551875.1 LysR family transcriptional regulator [Pseudarthrobacter sp. C1]WPU09893.1 LysR family transcriptional regulator [Pseudarthrobacter oxydans]HET7783389.1 LysR family transcriptional regulator [Arthrobacter sp.]
METNPDDLLVLLAVSRSAKFTTAAQSLGLNHTTVSRRIAALEKSLGGRVLARAAGGWELTDLGTRAVQVAEQVEAAMGSLGPAGKEPDPITGVVRMTATDGFSAYIAAPAVARLRRNHPGLCVEVVTMTRRALQQRSGLDIEVVVGEPQVHRAEAVRLGEYMLGMYASRAYLAEHGTPASVAELNEHPLVYFVDSMLQVDDLDAPRRLVPGMRDGVTSTNVFVHVEATRAGAGIGFLPCFMGDLHDDLVRLLPTEIAELLPYWMVLRPDSLRRPAVAAVVQALREQVAAHREKLLGRGKPSSIAP